MIDHPGVKVRDLARSNAFYRAALAPLGYQPLMEFSAEVTGPRPHYHVDYYGSFVLDPDGHNIEVVCHDAA
jgi:catechol 2,3-dioxygenase-like lactoylglutathione lyase family enzyme